LTLLNLTKVLNDFRCQTSNFPLHLKHQNNLFSMAERNVKPRPIVLSIAGHDPSSGAGITADVKTCAAQGCYGVTCVTSLTVQSTRGVKSVEPVEGRVITDTLEELMSDLEIDAVKIGMLGSAEAARAVAAFLKRYEPRNVVLDPVLVSSSGASLLTKDGLQIVKDRILGMVSVITPNADEAAVLTGLTVNNLDEMRAAALRLRQSGVRNVIVTGGHLNPPSDLISIAASHEFSTLTGTKIAARSTHGTGCAFSTAVACRLAQGKNLIAAAKAAKAFVESALKTAPTMGRGIGPVV
jgi:hydroxymethylpyrimidine/phosphomethylpyrimidine kinase